MATLPSLRPFVPAKSEPVGKCPECAGHSVIPDPFFGGYITCPACCPRRPAAGESLTPVDLDAFSRELEAAAVRADNDAENHGAQWQRDRTAGVAQGLRQAVDMLHDMFGPPFDRADVLSFGDPADEPPTEDER